MADELDTRARYADPAWVRILSALYPLCLVVLTTALIVIVVFATEDPRTALKTVIAGLALALALH